MGITKQALATFFDVELSQIVGCSQRGDQLSVLVDYGIKGTPKLILDLSEFVADESESEPADESPDYAGMLKKELVKLAESAGIPNHDNMLKAELLEALEAL